jgi:fatty acid amide hydrolase
MSSTSRAGAAETLWLTAGEIAQRVTRGELSAAEVVAAHIERIEQVNGRLNALVIACYERARRTAQQIDERRARGEALGPLAGVPVSIKECFHVAGTPSTIGVGRFAREIIDADSPLVQRWERAGAVVLGKTNVPQLMILHETDNPVYGRTNNPWNLERSPGGSSGGEAALIAAGGAVLGLASDLGGSIRQPAHSCGICGLLPTLGRIESTGKRGNFAGMETLSLQPGPLARTVADLELAFRTMCDASGGSRDSRVPVVEVPAPQNVDIARLRVGLLADDGFFPSSPALRRAVDEAGRALADVGAQVEVFSLPDMAEVVRLYLGLISADGAANLVRSLGASTADWRIRRFVRLAGLSRAMRALVVGAMSATGQRGLAELISWGGAISADRYWQLTHARAEYVRRFVARLDAARLDVLLLPPHALPALTHGSTMHLTTAASYCFLANLLGMPAGVVPVTRVRPSEESDRPASRDLVVRSAAEVEQGSAGLPVGVQVLGRHWREDTVLAVMGALEHAFRARPDFPLHPPEWEG